MNLTHRAHARSAAALAAVPPLTAEEAAEAEGLAFPTLADGRTVPRADRRKLLALALLAARGPEHVVLLGEPVAVAWEVRDVLIAHLLARGVTQEEVSRLHGWASMPFWAVFKRMARDESVGPDQSVELQAGPPQAPGRGKRRDYDKSRLAWMAGALVFRIPAFKSRPAAVSAPPPRHVPTPPAPPPRRDPPLPQPPPRFTRPDPLAGVEVIRRGAPAPRCP